MQMWGEVLNIGKELCTECVELKIWTRLSLGVELKV